jgi:hypothetical protein
LPKHFVRHSISCLKMLPRNWLQFRFTDCSMWTQPAVKTLRFVLFGQSCLVVTADCFVSHRHAPSEKKWLYACRLFGTCSLKEGPMRQDAWKQKWWSQKRRSLLGNGSENTFRGNEYTCNNRRAAIVVGPSGLGTKNDCWRRAAVIYPTVRKSRDSRPVIWQ